MAAHRAPEEGAEPAYRVRVAQRPAENGPVVGNHVYSAATDAYPVSAKAYTSAAISLAHGCHIERSGGSSARAWPRPAAERVVPARQVRDLVPGLVEQGGGPVKVVAPILIAATGLTVPGAQSRMPALMMLAPRPSPI